MTRSYSLKLAFGLMTKQADTSWIGRYLTAKKIPETVMLNDQKIMAEIDPEHKIPDDQPILYGDDYKRYRNKGFDYIRQDLKRKASGNVGASAGWGALAGALGGGLTGLRAMDDSRHDTGSLRNYLPLIGLGGGAVLGAGMGAANNLWSKFKNKMITDDDIAIMKERQKDRSLLGSFVPFRDMYDAATVGHLKDKKDGKTPADAENLAKV